MRSLRLALLASVLFSIPATPAFAEPPAFDLAITDKKLANGLTVIVHEDHRTPTVSVDIWYDVGSKDDPPGRSGFAHLFEHVMLQGSRHVPEDAYFRFLEQAGATDRNATTGGDRTNYFETVPTNELELALWLESDRMAFLLDHLDEKTFQNQRDVVENERRQSFEDKPYGFTWMLLNEALFPAGHPYHRDTIGDPKDLDASNVDEARAFFRTFYRPNNATLVIAGDVKPDAAFAQAEKWFGAIVARPVPPRVKPPAVVLHEETRLEVAAGVKLAKVYIGWPAPAWFAGDDAELNVLGDVLGKGESSRLKRKLVRELQVAESVKAYVDSEAYAGNFVIEAVARPGHTGDELIKLIDAELTRAKSDVSTDEIDRAKGPIFSDWMFRFERNLKRADALAEYNQIAHDPRYLTQDLAHYRAVSADGVKRAATRWLPLDRRVIEVVTPTEGAQISGELRKTSSKPAVGQ